MITHYVTTDGRAECLTRALDSYERMALGPVERRIIWDDSGDYGYRRWLIDSYGDRYTIGWPAQHRIGLTASMQALWPLEARAPTPYVFHTEDDFVLNREVNLLDFVHILAEHPHLAQVAMLRAPYYPRELRAGSILAQNPKAYSEHRAVVDEAKHWPRSGELAWIEHNLFWTNNPSIYHRSICRIGWPDAFSSEAVVGQAITAAGKRFAFFGSKSDEPLITHIGDRRAGHGY